MVRKTGEPWETLTLQWKAILQSKYYLCFNSDAPFTLYKRYFIKHTPGSTLAVVVIRPFVETRAGTTNTTLYCVAGEFALYLFKRVKLYIDKWIFLLEISFNITEIIETKVQWMVLLVSEWVDCRLGIDCIWDNNNNIFLYIYFLFLCLMFHKDSWNITSDSFFFYIL